MSSVPHFVERFVQARWDVSCVRAVCERDSGMKINEIKSSIGRRCRMEDPNKWCWTLPLTGVYVITGHSYEVEYYDGKPRRTVRVQVESVDLRPLRSWVPPERIILLEEQNNGTDHNDTY